MREDGRHDGMVIIRGRDKGLETGATISASTTRTHTLDACLFISVRKARKRLDRASWLVCLSPRLVSFPSFWIWGNCPNWTWASSRMMNIPAHLFAGQFVQHSRFTPSSSRTITREPLHRTIITHPLPAHISFHATRGLFSLGLLLRLTSISFNHNTATERPPNQPCQPNPMGHH